MRYSYRKMKEVRFCNFERKKEWLFVGSNDQKEESTRGIMCYGKVIQWGV